jgi:MYND finger
MGCGEMLPVLKRCSVCQVGFCDADCMRASWSQHRRVCLPPSTEETEAEKQALAEILERRARACPCGKPDAHLRCSRCDVLYCSKACQVACWCFHRHACVRVSSSQ